MNKKTCIFKLLSFCLSIVLIAVSALFLAGCDNNTLSPTPTPTLEAQATPIPPITVGEGATEFAFEVYFLDGTQKNYTVKTNETTVGKALLGVGLIAGEEGPYGLYVKTVDGQTVDYDVDGKYWAFYANGTMSPLGVDSTNIEQNTTYAFKAE